MGSPADLTGQEGDVMVVFLEFWYKWYKVDDNKFLYQISPDLHGLVESDDIGIDFFVFVGPD